MEILLIATFALSLCGAITGLRACRLLSRRPPDRLPEEAAPMQSEKKTLTVDEGFENLMAYQVSLGRGKTTGGEA